MPFHWPTQGISLATGHASTGEMRRWSLRAPARPGDRQSLESEQAQEGHLAGPRASGMHPGGLLRGSGTEAEVPELEGHSRSEGTEQGRVGGKEAQGPESEPGHPPHSPLPRRPQYLTPTWISDVLPPKFLFLGLCCQQSLVSLDPWPYHLSLCLCCHMIICVQITLL